MYHLKNFLSFPPILVKRQSLTYSLNTSFLGGRKEYDENGNQQYILNFNCNNHNVILNIMDKDITIDSSLKVSCDCDSFKFEFAHALFKKNLIYNPYDIMSKELFDQKPKKNNNYIISGCKHIIHCSNYLLSHIKQIKGSIK